MREEEVEVSLNHPDNDVALVAHEDADTSGDPIDEDQDVYALADEVYAEDVEIDESEAPE